MSERSWLDNLRLLSEFWPNWKPTPAMSAEFRDRLGSQGRQDWVEQAIRDHYATDLTRDGQTVPTPSLARLLQRNGDIAKAGNIKPPRDEKKVDWVAVKAEVDRDADMIDAALRSWGPHRVAEAFNELREPWPSTWLKFHHQPEDFTGWPRFVRGLVWAAGSPRVDLKISRNDTDSLLGKSSRLP
jgi:hypothetical protein